MVYVVIRVSNYSYENFDEETELIGIFSSKEKAYESIPMEECINLDPNGEIYDYEVWDTKSEYLDDYYYEDGYITYRVIPFELDKKSNGFYLH